MTFIGSSPLFRSLGSDAAWVYLALEDAANGGASVDAMEATPANLLATLAAFVPTLPRIKKAIRALVKADAIAVADTGDVTVAVDLSSKVDRRRRGAAARKRTQRERDKRDPSRLVTRLERDMSRDVTLRRRDMSRKVTPDVTRCHAPSHTNGRDMSRVGEGGLGGEGTPGRAEPRGSVRTQTLTDKGQTGRQASASSFGTRTEGRK